MYLLNSSRAAAAFEFSSELAAFTPGAWIRAQLALSLPRRMKSSALRNVELRAPSIERSRENGIICSWEVKCA